MLTQEDKAHILSGFPDIKLSYENITHKKVYNSDIIMAIPEGRKCFAWFSHFNDAPVCFIMDLDKQQISQIQIMSCCFNTDLAYGTIFYGTLFYQYGNPFFAMEDIFYYKGTDISRKNWGDKMVLFHTILKNDLSQISYNKSFIVFGMPLFAKTFEEIVTQIKANTGYKISIIQFRLYNRSNNYLYMQWVTQGMIKERSQNRPLPFTRVEECKTLYETLTPFRISNAQMHHNLSLKTPSKVGVSNEKLCKKPTTHNQVRECVFLVKPDIQNDIYHLYAENDEYQGIAYIPDYKTSVLMNKLFRNIKENDNLDTLEESDDEDEFEDERDDRFVFLERAYKMVCAYNYKFKKWGPLHLAEKNKHL